MQQVRIVLYTMANEEQRATQFFELDMKTGIGEGKLIELASEFLSKIIEFPKEGE